MDDIDSYFKAADIFLNPVLSGGGIKTKMVEAIGFGTTVISTESGAAGIDKSVCDNKLITVNDLDWEKFADAIFSATHNAVSATPQEYYNVYAWANIIPGVVAAI